MFERGTWGGRRSGAGRPRKPRQSDVPHRLRPVHRKHVPVHVTLRAIRYDLRQAKMLKILRGAIERLANRAAFHVVHYSLQANHVHLIVEANDKRALSRGMQHFASSLARRYNRRIRRKAKGGKLWAYRYHAHELASPAEVRHALVYVLRNGVKHGVARDEDPYSSAHAFDGFADKKPYADELPASTTWLLTTGWRRRGLIRAHERPKPDDAPIIWDYVYAS
jgi:REP element-mobilizing transposase RayT